MTTACFHDELEKMMELCTGYHEELARNDRCEAGVDVAERRVSRTGSRRRPRERPASAAPTVRSAAGRGGRYERFEPITVRAAARVLHLQRSGVVTPREARFYLSELAEMDAHAGRG